MKKYIIALSSITLTAAIIYFNSSEVEEVAIEETSSEELVEIVETEKVPKSKEIDKETKAKAQAELDKMIAKFDKENTFSDAEVVEELKQMGFEKVEFETDENGEEFVVATGESRDDYDINTRYQNNWDSSEAQFVESLNGEEIEFNNEDNKMISQFKAGID